MSPSTAMQSSTVEAPTLEELLANVLRNAGWIMAGGSAQFRQGALIELQSNLHLVHRNVRDERVLQLANVLDERATKVASSKANDAESMLGLCRVLGEFEQAMKACLASRKVEVGAGEVRTHKQNIPRTIELPGKWQAGMSWLQRLRTT